MKTLSAQMISTECEEDDFTINSYGAREWKNAEGLLHREDAPAVEYANGSKFWYLNGLSHREDGPAAEWADGTKLWYLNSSKTTEEEVRKLGKMKPLTF